MQVYGDHGVTRVSTELVAARVVLSTIQLRHMGAWAADAGVGGG